VRHPDNPGAYILAVECDGATYHSALWARERDRLRQDVLEHLGWRFHRIWSTDWFYNRPAEMERLRTILFEAKTLSENGLKIDGANIARLVESEPDPQLPTEFELPPPVVRHAPRYRRAVFPVRHALEPHEAPVSLIADLTQKIINAEGPIHFEEVVRRVAASFGREKAGSRIVAATRNALAKAALGNADLITDGAFWFTSGQAMTPPVRDRSAESGATLKASNISLLEIKAAMMMAREDNAAGSDGDLVRAAARLLGFQRVGPELQARIAEGL
jgi:restriction endonuclease-like protein/uncharacterized protein DUF3320